VSTLSPKLLATQLGDLLRDAPPEEHARPVAVRHVGAWDGPDRIVVGGTVRPLVQADSVLGVRAALVEQEGQPLVLLTSVTLHEMGKDAVARLFRRSIFVVNPWTLLQARFQASAVDPRLRDEQVAHALVECAPPTGFDPAPGGVLDQDTAMTALARHRFQLVLDGSEGRDVAFVRWLLEPETGRRYSRELPQVRQSFQSWLVGILDTGSSRLAGLSLALLASGQEVAPWLLLIETILEGPSAVTGAVSALVRQASGGVDPDEATVRRLGDTLRTIAASNAAAMSAHAEALDRTFASQHEALARSRYGLVGLRARQDALATALESPEPVWAAAAELRAHHQADETTREAALAFARLHTWLHATRGSARNLEEASRQYIETSCWVDRARAAAEGVDFPGPVQVRLEAFLGKCTARREDENSVFGQRLAAWNADSNGKLSQVCPIEAVLDRVVAPLLKQAPVLLLVLDGLPLAIAHQLLDGLGGRDFHVVVTPDGSQAALSTVPTRTEWARTSLFAGSLCEGNLAVEKRAFSEHAGLKSACRGQKPPSLFHFADLNDRPQVESAVADSTLRMVGVVINAVDDELSGSAQYVRAWRPESVVGLMALLKAARDAGRVVVLTSDHGHVPHRKDTRSRPLGGSLGGERWTRPRPVEDGEVLVQGPRVAPFVEGGSVVVPAIERLRYTTGKASAGYHGGATPQEVLAPLFVLWPSRNAESMPVSLERTPPPFWHPPRPEGEQATEAPPVLAPSAVAPVSSTQASLGDLPLFAAAAAVPQPVGGTWSTALRASTLFNDRFKRALIRGPEPVDAFIDVLAEAGGRITLVRLGRLLNRSESRIRGLAFSLKSVLNVDGYGVLTVEEEEGTVVLDLRLLKAQFELGA
jgi:hypothetical protein